MTIKNQRWDNDFDCFIPCEQRGYHSWGLLEDYLCANPYKWNPKKTSVPDLTVKERQRLPGELRHELQDHQDHPGFKEYQNYEVYHVDIFLMKEILRDIMYGPKWEQIKTRCHGYPHPQTYHQDHQAARRVWRWRYKRPWVNQLPRSLTLITSWLANPNNDKYITWLANQLEDLGYGQIYTQDQTRRYLPDDPRYKL